MDASGPAGTYWLHSGSFMVDNGLLITYTMALRVRTGLLVALVTAVSE